MYHMKAGWGIIIWYCVCTGVLCHAGGDIYAGWQKVLEEHVDDNGVHYAALKESPQNLNAYMTAVSGVSGHEYDSWSTQDQIAFWINLYNASVIKIVTDHYPIENYFSWKTILYDHPSIQYIDRVWEKSLMKVFEKEISLNEILQLYLRQFGEPRIHFAIVHAALGNGPLSRKVYRGDSLDAQLDEQVKIWFADRTKNYADVSRQRLCLSKIFKWYDSDFESAGGVMAFARHYGMEGLPADDEIVSWNIHYLKFDWKLNDSK